MPTQSSPLHFNPLMKVDFGWVRPRIIEDTTLDVELRPRASHPDLVLVPTRRVPEGAEGHDACAQDPLNTGQVQTANFLADNGDCLVEGYLLEFLSPTSASWDREQCTFTPADFDRQMYGTGLAVWHYDLSSYEQLGNDNRLRPMLDLEEFDRRDDAQELEQDITRAQPLDLFWGDPVGISSATADTGGASSELAPPAGSPYTVTAPPGTAATTEGWTAPADTPDGALMEVTLSWTTQDVDDWDLAVQKKVGDTWQEVATTGSLPGSGAEVAQVAVEPGAEYRAEAVNYASASTTAEVAVAYVHDASIATKFGPANTDLGGQRPDGVVVHQHPTRRLHRDGPRGAGAGRDRHAGPGPPRRHDRRRLRRLPGPGHRRRVGPADRRGRVRHAAVARLQPRRQAGRRPGSTSTTRTRPREQRPSPPSRATSVPTPVTRSRST